MRNSSGQNVVEYLLLVTTVLIVAIVFLGKNGPFHRSVEGVLNETVEQLNDLRNEINFAK